MKMGDRCECPRCVLCHKEEKVWLRPEEGTCCGLGMMSEEEGVQSWEEVEGVDGHRLRAASERVVW